VTLQALGISPPRFGYHKEVMAAPKDLSELIGMAPDQLGLATRHAVVGSYIAMRIYSPQNLALQRIEAAGASVGECIEQLKARGLDPMDHEFSRLNPPFLAR